jgi:hypothetical protein
MLLSLSLSLSYVWHCSFNHDCHILVIIQAQTSKPSVLKCNVIPTTSWYGTLTDVTCNRPRIGPTAFSGRNLTFFLKCSQRRFHSILKGFFRGGGQEILWYISPLMSKLWHRINIRTVITNASTYTRIKYIYIYIYIYIYDTYLNRTVVALLWILASRILEILCSK